MSIAERFENSLSKWSTLKLISTLWKHKFFGKQDWKNNLILHAITKRGSKPGQDIRYIGALRIDRLLRDRNRARKLLVQVFTIIGDTGDNCPVHKKYEDYLKYASGTDKDKV